MTATMGPVQRESDRAPARRRRRTGHHGWAILGFTAPFVVLFALFYVVPIAYAVRQSFFKLHRTGAYGTAKEVFGGFTQYGRVFRSSDFWTSMRHVGVLLVVQVPLTVGLGLIFALLIDSPLVKARRFFRLAFFAPYAVPGVIAAIMWGYFYAPTLSPLPKLARSLDLLAPDGILFAIVNIVVWTVAGFNMLIMYSALQAIPQDLYEAATIDGAGQLRLAVSVKVPLILPSIIMTIVLSLIGTLQLFNEPTVLKNLSRAVGGAYTPNMLVFSTAAVPDYDQAAAFSVVLALITAVLSFVFLRATRGRAFA